MPSSNGQVSESQLDYHLKAIVEQVTAVKMKQEREAKTNEDLRSQLERLDRAYTSLQAEKRALEDKLRADQRIQDSTVGSERRVICLIDGDGAIFSRALVTRGRSGGLDAARTLIDNIKESVRTSVLDASQFKLWIYCFLNRRGILGPLDVSEAVFDDFISGFNQAGGEFTFLVDIGYGKEAADARIRELLDHSIHSSHTLKLYCAVGHDAGYVPVLDSVITHGLRSKIVLLAGYKTMNVNIKRLNFPTLIIPDLFERQKLATASPMAATSHLSFSESARSSPRRQVVSPPVLVESDSESIISFKGEYTNTKFSSNYTSSPLYLKPGIPPFANRPAPCNAYYLLGTCPHGDSCDYSHDYILREGELEYYRESLQQVACRSIEKGTPCNNPNCFYGHKAVCKYGTKCKYWKNGKGFCRHGGAEAHLGA